MKKVIKSIFGLLLFIIIVGFCAVYFVYNYMYPMQYKEDILKYAEEYDIDPYLVYAIINVESGFNTSAESGAQARGLMQIREITADWAKEHIKLEELSEEDYFDPEINLNIGCWYISKLYSLYDGDVNKIAAAYNAGVGNLNKWIEEGRDIDAGDIPFSETQKYIERVNSNIEVYKVLYGDNYTKSDVFNAALKIIKVIYEKGKTRVIKLIDKINDKVIER